MQFFLDTADIDEIRQGLDWGMVDGVTTNPSLIAKAGKPYLPTVKEIAELVPGPVSGEVLATDLEAGRGIDWSYLVVAEADAKGVGEVEDSEGGAHHERRREAWRGSGKRRVAVPRDHQRRAGGEEGSA